MAIGIGCQLLTYACHRLGGAAASRATAAHGVEESTAEAQPAQYESEFTVTADDDPEEFPDDTELRLPELTACPPRPPPAPRSPDSLLEYMFCMCRKFSWCSRGSGMRCVLAGGR